MRKIVQKIGMAIAVPFTFVTSVAVAQCPTINSLNLSTTPAINGQINVTANMSTITLPGYFIYKASRVGYSNTYSVDTSAINSASLFCLGSSNGDYEVTVNYIDTINNCTVTSTGNISVLNTIDTVSNCPRIRGYMMTEVGSTINLALAYKGGLSNSYSIDISVPVGITYSVLSTGVYNLFNVPLSSITNFTFSITDPTNTICPTDVQVITTDTCGAFANFTMVADSINLGTYNVNNYSSTSGTSSYLWDFGDGNTSSLAYPTHTYSVAGFYTVCVTVTSSSGCSDTKCMLGGFKVSSGGKMTKIVVKNPNAPTSIDEQELVSSLSAYPNPVADELTIELNGNNTIALVYTITDALGKIVSQNKLTDAKTIVNTANFNNGFYVLSILNEKGQVLKTNKLVK